MLGSRRRGQYLRPCELVAREKCENWYFFAGGHVCRCCKCGGAPDKSLTVGLTTTEADSVSATVRGISEALGVYLEVARLRFRFDFFVLLDTPAGGARKWCSQQQRLRKNTINGGRLRPVCHWCW
jgi:hypothetical protein